MPGGRHDSFQDMERSHKIRNNYDLLSSYNYFIPNPLEILAILFLLLGGALIGNMIAAGFMLLMPGATSDLLTLISYPVMFIPPMIYASSRSRSNAMFDEGRTIDAAGHWGNIGMLGCAAMVMVATVALSFLVDIVNSLMPAMPEWLENMLKGMTQGHFLINFICVSVFAPFFEEWLCRGMVLRGLLNYKRRSKADGTIKYGIKPVWAIVISALFFALIHMNPWQAIPAFVLGCLFGYVYYRTGSLKLTMLMHFTNNTLALVMGNIDSLKDMDTWLDVFPMWQYCLIALSALVYLWIFVRTMNLIPLDSPTGNCDETKTM